ncbi:gp170 [Bacillus phage W.Ph.]|uniref:Gp170 n=1 Tax=Bacillus phage W.Ph. TaxID=764595 RepID=G9B1S1_9CAUD|nr:gp170 [Bacillus phage W.Ph.]ADH03316.2 gp170 [Bacillus phage W.Ph.]
MSILLAIFGLAALYIVVHLYSNSTPNKTKDRRPPDKATHKESICDKQRLEQVRRETREFLNKQPPIRNRTSVGTSSLTDKGYRLSEYNRREQERERDEQRRREYYNSDFNNPSMFFVSPNTGITSSSQECKSSISSHHDNSNNHHHNDHSPSSSPDSICSFD